MAADKYAIEFGRAICNWNGGKDIGPESVFNAFHTGIKNDMEMLLPIEVPADVLRRAIKEGDKADSEMKISIRSISAGEDGKYLIPLFTSEEEMKKGEETPVLNRNMKDLMDLLYNDPVRCLGFVVNPWGKKMILSKDTLEVILGHTYKSHINFIRGSVVDMAVGAIVNAANTSLLGGGGVDGAIHKAAGPELLEECRTLNGCETGKAKITGAYGITYADHIIHTPGPVYSGKSEDADLLASCYTSSLDLALENGCTSIAFPGISTGVYGYPIEEATQVSLFAVAKWLNDHPDTVMDVYFCCFNDREYDAYKKLLEA